MWQTAPTQRVLVPYLPSTPILNKPKPNSGFSKLPLELLIRIIYDLTSTDIVSLKTVNHKLWNIVTPAIFNSIIKHQYASKSQLLCPGLVEGWLVPKHPAIRRLEDEITREKYLESPEYKILCGRWLGYRLIQISWDFSTMSERLCQWWRIDERDFRDKKFPYPPPLGSPCPRDEETKTINIQYADLELEKLEKLLTGRRDEFNAPLKKRLSVPRPHYLRFLEEWPLDKIKYMLGDDGKVSLALRTVNGGYDPNKPSRFNRAAMLFLAPWLEYINGLPIESGLGGMSKSYSEIFRSSYGIERWEGLEPYGQWFLIEELVLDATKLRDGKRRR